MSHTPFFIESKRCANQISCIFSLRNEMGTWIMRKNIENALRGTKWEIAFRETGEKGTWMDYGEKKNMDYEVSDRNPQTGEDA